jgi:hypothetical protein
VQNPECKVQNEDRKSSHRPYSVFILHSALPRRAGGLDESAAEARQGCGGDCPLLAWGNQVKIERFVPFHASHQFESLLGSFDLIE